MIYTRTINLPIATKGLCVKDENGDFNIYINSKLSDAEQKRTFLHEIKHIELKHFEKDDPVSEKEQEVKS